MLLMLAMDAARPLPGQDLVELAEDALVQEVLVVMQEVCRMILGGGRQAIVAAPVRIVVIVFPHEDATHELQGGGGSGGGGAGELRCGVGAEDGVGARKEGVGIENRPVVVVVVIDRCCGRSSFHIGTKGEGVDILEDGGPIDRCGGRGSVIVSLITGAMGGAHAVCLMMICRSVDSHAGELQRGCGTEMVEVLWSDQA
jgi:hypothetical protein